MFGASNITASSNITLVSQNIIGTTSDGWNSGHSMNNLNCYGWWFPQLWRDHIKIPMASIVPILDSLIPELYDLMQPSPVFFLPNYSGSDSSILGSAMRCLEARFGCSTTCSLKFRREIRWDYLIYAYYIPNIL
jgi:hypothetical protein